MSFFSSDEEEDDKTLQNKALDDRVFQQSHPYDEQFTKATQLLNDSFVKLNAHQHELGFKVQGPLKKQIEVIDPGYEESFGIFNLVNCPDKESHDVFITFSYLEHEVNKMVLKFDEKYFNPLVTYGLHKDTDDQNEEYLTMSGEKELWISNMLLIFKDVFDLLKRCSLIMINIVNQLHNLYFSKEKFFKDTYKNYDLFSALDTLGKLCSLVYTIDLILLENVAIKEDFNRYKNVIRNMYKDPAKFNVTEVQLKKLERLLNRYERTILSGACFVGTTNQTFDQKPDIHFTTAASNKAIKDNSELHTLFMSYFKIHLTKAIEMVGTATETNERKTLYQHFCLYALYRKLFPKTEDRPLWKQFWSVQKKAPILVIGSHLVFNIADFMNNIVQLSRKALSKDPKDAEVATEEYIDLKDDKFEKEMSSYYSQFVVWATQIDTRMGKSHTFVENKGINVYQQKIKLLLSGYVLASQIKQNVTTLAFLHIKKGVSLTSSLVKDIATGCMLLKAIKYILDEHQEGFPAYFLAKFSGANIRNTLQQFQERVKKLKKPPKELVSALSVLENLFDGSFSSLRKAATNTCLNYLNYKKDKIFKEQELDDFRYYLWRTNFLANYQRTIKEVTDCSFLYWMKDLLPLFMNQISENPAEMKRLKFLTLALQDCETQLKGALHLENKMELFEAYKQEVISNIQDVLLKRICQEIDDHLRLLMHSILIEKLKGKNPFEMPSKPIHHFLMNGSIDIFGVVIDPVEQVSKHLNETFYNLNVLNLHDYETYEGLRNLARELFGVDLLNPYLPSQSLEKGNVDILTIMRNIGSFVNNFNYSLFTQTFIESKKESTMLNTIGIKQIADSVQTHGVGILNTSANLVYQFILKKFNIFNQFLFDEMVQTPLRREMRQFRENKNQWEGRYPIARAELVAKEIKKLGLFEDNKTYLDKFRMLLTTVGNALGFVRLLRSASLSYLSKQIEFLPFDISFEEAELNENFYLELAKAANFSGVSCGAANQLDDVIKTLKVSFSQRTDYLRILAKAFDGMLAGQESKHLKFFYFLIPALSLNYIDAMVNAKERIVKKRASDTFIFDDGFVLGVVYFLRVLNQNNKFDSLHWFEEARKKFERDLGGIKEREHEMTRRNTKKGGPSLEEDNEASILMSAQKTTVLLEEFTQFQHSFNTARVLLKEMTTDTF